MTWNLPQSIFMMSQAANAVSDIGGTQQTLIDYLTAYLSDGTDGYGNPYTGFFTQLNDQLIGGDWSVVWGPGVCTESPLAVGLAANAMYVAYSPSQKVYVVAIAGTNFDNIYDWIDEDGDIAIDDMAPWPLTLPYTSPNQPPPSGPAVSGATATGVSNLLCTSGMVDPTNGTLDQYLSNNASDDATLVFAGHSLGGALAPTLAFHLYSSSTGGSWKKVLVMATAGASPGNADFASAYETAYPAAPSGVSGWDLYPSYNVDFANQHDVVPRAWDDLGSVLEPKYPIIGGKRYFYFASIYGPLSSSVGSALYATLNQIEPVATTSDMTSLTHVQFSTDRVYPVWTQGSGPGTYTYPPTWATLSEPTIFNPIGDATTLGTYVDSAHLDQYPYYLGLYPAPRFPAVPFGDASVADAASVSGRRLMRQARLEAAPLARRRNR